MEVQIDRERIDAIFFDVGNTLLRAHPSVEAVCKHILEQFGYQVTEEKLRQGILEADRYYEKRYWEDDSFWSNEDDASRIWAEMYARMMEAIGIDGDRHLIGRAIYDYFGHGDRWRTFPDVVPVFRELKSEGYTIALVSNWDSRLAKLCFDMGLDRYLEAVISSASIGLIKPDPRIFEVACDRVGVEPARAIHIGDHYYADILGARSAGLQAVLIDRF
ncbi:MAG: HAD-IA family hydrolase, partial [Actinobacteria bacterium]|nr:HAD-IA family hydrolase [Actinomycetota bacterium]